MLARDPETDVPASLSSVSPGIVPRPAKTPDIDGDAKISVDSWVRPLKLSIDPATLSHASIRKYAKPVNVTSDATEPENRLLYSDIALTCPWKRSHWTPSNLPAPNDAHASAVHGQSLHVSSHVAHELDQLDKSSCESAPLNDSNTSLSAVRTSGGAFAAA